jgi:hypothetical protein
MDKQTITPRSHEELIREYPITGLVEGWYFRQREVSAGCYVVEGSDVHGRTVSRQTLTQSWQSASRLLVRLFRAELVSGTIHLFEIAQILGYFQEMDSDADTSNHGWTPG